MRTWMIVALAGCTSAAHQAPVIAPVQNPPVLAGGSGGTPAPWPTPVAVPVPTLATQTRPLPHDLASLKSAGGVTIAPDGSRVAYTVRVPRFDPNAKPSPDDTKAGWKLDQQIYVVDLANSHPGTPRQITFGEEPARSPKFSPDGKQLAFIRKKGQKAAIHVIDLGGGEARAVDLGDYDAQDYAWSPDGKAFAFLAARPATEDVKKARWQRGGARPYEADREQTHLFVVPITGGEPRHVNRGNDTVLSFRWSPDAKHFALVVHASLDVVEQYAGQRVIVVDAADGGNARELSKSDPPINLVTQIAWSPDSRRVGFLTTTSGLSHIDQLRIAALDGSPATNAAAKLDPSLDGFVWAGDSKTVFATASARTVTKLYRLSLDGKSATEVAIGKRTLGPIEADRSGRFVVANASTPVMPNEPTLIDTQKNTATSIVNLHPELRDWTIARTEIVTWKNKEGTPLDGILVVTGHAQPGRAPPLLVMPHGGPDGVSSETWNGWAQFFAARGYSVFQPNYRGGIGYGRAFYEANRGRLGEIEFADIESGVDALIASGKADAGRLFYGGWSWGGYLSAWTLGHTDRYRAIMVGAGVVDVVLQYVTSDINHGAAADWEYKARPWAKPDAFEKANPARFLAAAKTPTLIMHGEDDPRVPFVNAQILYRALADRNVPVTMWAYPREPHGFQEPAHFEHLMTTWAAFFDAHLPK